MTEQSGFFDPPIQEENFPPSTLEPLSVSGSGLTRLYLCREGGRSRVYKALAPQYCGDPLYENLLRKEFEIGFSAMHLHICEYYAYKQIPRIGNAIEMEWIDGKTLEQLMDEGALTPDMSRKILDELCDALAYLHRKQIFHRDIKPGNIMVTNHGGNVKLIDFSCADSDLHYANKGASGTRRYASPELVAGKPVDARTDIYSLGILIGEMAPRLKRIAQRCTEADPERRFPSVEVLRTALHRQNVFRQLTRSVALSLVIIAMAVLSVRSVTRQNQARHIDQAVQETADRIRETLQDPH